MKKTLLVFLILQIIAVLVTIGLLAFEIVTDVWLYPIPGFNGLPFYGMLVGVIVIMSMNALIMASMR